MSASATSPASPAVSNSKVPLPNAAVQTPSILAINGQTADPIHIHNVERAYLGVDTSYIGLDSNNCKWSVLDEDASKVCPNGHTSVSTFHAAVFENATREIRSLVEDTREAAHIVSAVLHALKAEHATFRMLMETMIQQEHRRYTASLTPCLSAINDNNVDGSNLSQYGTPASGTATSSSNISVASQLAGNYYSDVDDDEPAWIPFPMRMQTSTFFSSSSI
ncbi:hypothetical protein CVT24_008583 [Panaeolus cyanescens]|uniref:Uncharacterized protein n=1 Tax=Panaeolus cyanescens TaxID=181874 RepID=A0A409XAH0_9AGAR|nr:hypothetical protein CVT24_008583 [Panaeolus cyanescens]